MVLAPANINVGSGGISCGNLTPTNINVGLSGISCGTLKCSDLDVKGNSYIYSGNEAANVTLYFGTLFTGTPTGASKSAIIAEAISVSKNIFTGGYNIDTQSGTIKAGIIGIGLSGTPFTRLHVSSYSTGSGQKNLRYFDYDTSSFSYTQLNDVCAIFDRKSWIASSSDISTNTKIDIIDLSGNKKTYTITEITENYITIDKEIKGSTCFVYGYQELHRKIEAQQTKINESENTISAILARLDTGGLA